MSANEPGKLATDYGAREQKRLIAITVTAESVESDSNRVHHHRGELNPERSILQQSQNNCAAGDGHEQQCKHRKAQDRTLLCNAGVRLRSDALNKSTLLSIHAHTVHRWRVHPLRQTVVIRR